MKAKWWVVWANCLDIFDMPRTVQVDVKAATRNEALRKGNKKIGVPPDRRGKLRVFERKPLA